MRRLAKFGAQRDAQIALHNGIERAIGKAIREGAVLKAGNERGAARGLDHRAVHQIGQFLDHRLAAAGVNRMADQQDRLFRSLDQPRGFRDQIGIAALVDQAILGRRRWRGHVQLFHQDMAGQFDIDRAGRAAHRLADGFVDDLVGLVGIFDRAEKLDRIAHQRLVADELNAPPAHAALGHAGALTAEENHRRILNQAALDGWHQISQARPKRADGDGGLAGDPRGRLGHEAAGRLMMRRDDFPAARFGFKEQVDEIGIGDAENRLDALGFQQLQDALVNRNAGGGRSGRGLRIVVVHFRVPLLKR